MTYIAVRCPHCDSAQIVKRGKTHRGTQRSLCQNTACARGSFLLDYRNRGCLPEVKQQIIDMSLNASGVRDTARSLHICPNTMLRELKQELRGCSYLLQGWQCELSALEDEAPLELPPGASLVKTFTFHQQIRHQT